MRGDDDRSTHLFSYVSPEQRVHADHPLRAIRTMTDETLRRLAPRFETLYASRHRRSVDDGLISRLRDARRSRPSSCCVPFCCRSCIRSGAERLLMEHLQYNLLFR
jgi:hypothetical protein